MFYELTNHIDVRYHFILDVIAHGDIVVSKVSTHGNLGYDNQDTSSYQY